MQNRSNSGFSILEVLIAAGIMGVVALGTVTMVEIGNKGSKQTTALFQVDTLKRNFSAYVLDDAAWGYTVADATNTTLACLRNGTNCYNISGTIRIRDSSNAIAFGYDPLSSSTAGFNFNGEVCNTFDDGAYDAGNNFCPFRMTFTYTAICAADPCTSPKNKIVGTLQYRPKLNDQTHAIPINTSAAGFTVIRGATANTLEATCTSLGGTFDQSDDTCELEWYKSGTYTIWNNTGGVGVGTTAPGAKLDVAFGGNAILVGADSNAFTRTDATQKRGKIGFPHYTNAEEAVLLVFGQVTATENEVNIGGGTGTHNAATEINLYTASDTTTTSGTERLVVKSDGNVGINTTAPVSLFQINSTSSGITRGFSVATGGQNFSRLDNNGLNTPLVIQNLGMTAAGHGATIDFGLNSGSPANYTTYMYGGRIAAISETTYASGTGNTADASLVFYSALNNALVEGMRITSAGNVGIGTTSPQKLLQVAGAAGTTNLLLTNTATGNANTDGLNIGMAADGTDAFVWGYEDTWLRFATNNTEKMRIQADGNVGIGVSSPIDLLHLSAASAGALKMVLRLDNETNNSGSAAGLTFQIGANTGDNRYKSGIAFERKTSNSRGTLHFLQNAADDATNAALTDAAMSIDMDGNVGIGTSAPTSQNGGVGLLVQHHNTDTTNNNNELAFSTAGTTADQAVALISAWSTAITSGNKQLGHIGIRRADTATTNATGYINFYVNNAGTVAEKMRITGAGNVGIGSSSPTQKLDVNGSVIASTYLFSSDRNLKKDFTPLRSKGSVLEPLATLHGQYFTFRDTGRRTIGLIAQDVNEKFPELVDKQKEGAWSIEYGGLIAVLVEAIKELYSVFQAKVTDFTIQLKDHNNRIIALEKENEELRLRLSNLELELTKLANEGPKD